VQKGDDVRNLTGRKWKCRHSFIRAPVTNDRPDQIAVFIMADEARTHEVRPLRSAICVCAMAERTMLKEILPPALRILRSHRVLLTAPMGNTWLVLGREGKNRQKRNYKRRC
jgi:hypothetical protein